MAKPADEVKRRIDETRAALDLKISTLGERASAVVEPLKGLDRQRALIGAAVFAGTMAGLLFRRRRRHRRRGFEERIPGEQRAMELVPEPRRAQSGGSGGWTTWLLPILEFGAMVGYAMFRGQSPLRAAGPAFAHVGAAARARFGSWRSG